MPISEYNGWTRYFAFKRPDTQEQQLATLSYMVSQGLGAKKAKLDDFLINKKFLSNFNHTPKKQDIDKQVQSTLGLFATKLQG